MTQTLTRQCVIGYALETLPKKYSKALNEQLQTKYLAGGETDYDICERMTEAGLRASTTSINRHRNQKCVCPKEKK